MRAAFSLRPSGARFAWRAPRVAALVCAGVVACMTGRAQAATCDDWPAYKAFVSRFVQQDGRVVDFSTPTQQTTSEGQSYGMFFALVANDRATFERLLRWTRANLSAGRFDGDDAKLPSWQWGRKPDGSYGVIDPNSAADSDLWIAYDLFEAGRLWHEPAYTKLAYALVTQIEKQEVADLRGLGPMLLPGPQGFRNGSTTRLNPSYLPLPLIRALGPDIAGFRTALCDGSRTGRLNAARVRDLRAQLAGPARTATRAIDDSGIEPVRQSAVA